MRGEGEGREGSERDWEGWERGMRGMWDEVRGEVEGYEREVRGEGEGGWVGREKEVRGEGGALEIQVWFINLFFNFFKIYWSIHGSVITEKEVHYRQLKEKHLMLEGLWSLYFKYIYMHWCIDTCCGWPALNCSQPRPCSSNIRIHWTQSLLIHVAFSLPPIKYTKPKAF